MRETGFVPAYATTAAGAPEDVEPEQKRRRSRRGSLAEDPDRQLSRDEFQELVADLDVEGEPKAGASGAVAQRQRRPRRHRGAPAAQDEGQGSGGRGPRDRGARRGGRRA